jgi:hypothetical protein
VSPTASSPEPVLTTASPPKEDEKSAQPPGPGEAFAKDITGGSSEVGRGGGIIIPSSSSSSSSSPSSPSSSSSSSSSSSPSPPPPLCIIIIIIIIIIITNIITIPTSHLTGKGHRDPRPQPGTPALIASDCRRRPGPFAGNEAAPCVGHRIACACMGVLIPLSRGVVLTDSISQFL